MSIEDWENGVNAIYERWDNKQENPSSTLGTDEALDMGILQPEEENNNTDIQNNSEQQEGQPTKVEIQPDERKYEKLGFWESQGDMLRAVGTEASHFFLPKALESDYQSRTHYAENMKYLYRYGVGTAAFIGSFMATGGASGAVGATMAASKVATVANAGTKAIKLGQGLQKLAKGFKIINTTQVGLKAAHAGKSMGTVKALMGLSSAANASVDYLAADAMASFFLSRPEEGEGHFADVFGETDNKFVSFLQTDPNDSNFEFRLKETVNNTLLGIPMGFGIGGTVSAVALQRPVRTFFKGLNKSLHAKTAKEASEGLAQTAEGKIALERIAKTEDFINEVELARKEAAETGQEVSQIIADRFPANRIEEAKELARLRDEGENIFTYEDGTWSIAVNNWEDAYKLTPEQYKAQLAASDLMGGESNLGNTALTHQDEAVKHTWTNRGWIGENEPLNGKTANKIVKNYKDKFEIDNNIKVEFVDGLTINGKAVDGNTTGTNYLGKTKKNNKIAIDKKKLQIKQIEDKITMAEGGNGEISDPVDVLKEQLRIAQEELKNLENPPKKQSNITIKIDKNARNPYATLRAEIEHARDIAKGEVPTTKDKHFSRYEGANEAEVAPDYVYKKSQGKAKALGEEVPSHNFMKDGQNPSNELKYKQETTNGQQGTTTTTDTDKQRKAEAVRRFVEGATGHNDSGSHENGLFVQRDNLWVVNETKGDLFDGANVSKASYQELPQTTEAGQQFADALSKAKKNLGADGENVDVHTAEDYANARTFLSEDGLSGVAVTKDGEIISVFVDPSAKVAEGRGRGRALVELAKQNGGTHLNCYDVGLPDYYKAHGFSETNRMKWSDEFWDKEKWHKELHTKYNNGEPDVVEMELGKTAKSGVEAPTETTAEQLKIDFNTKVNETVSTEDIGAKIKNGDIEFKTTDDIEATISHIMNNDKEISGVTFRDVAEDADNWFTQEMAENPVEYAVALGKRSPNEIDNYVREQLAAVKLLSVLKDLEANADPRETLKILTAARGVSQFIDNSKSRFGAALNYQKVINKAIPVFGSEKLSDLALQGITEIADILDNISLNFTRGQSLDSFKQEFMTNFQKHPAFNEIMGNKQLFSKLNEALETSYNGLKKGKKVDPSKVIVETLLREDAELCGWYAKLADTTKGFTDTIKYWGSQAPSYVINNVLGLGSAFKNISSGIVQSNLYPTYKILGGMLTGNGEITREGIDQWLSTFVNFGESMRLAKQAFLVGDGLLTNTKEFTEDGLKDGFHKWATNLQDIREDGFGITLQNIHSLVPRFMMASDEFMSQLNYRNIVRSKALSQARREAGILGDAAQSADDIFKKTAFTEDGRPLDFEAFVEAKDMLFQVPLNRKIYDPATGTKRDTGMDKTVLSQLGSVFQEGTQKFIPLRVFFPFIKTPVNIAEQALQSNPLYAVLNNNTRKKFFSTNPEVRAKAFGKMATMITLGAGFSIAAASGMITGSEPLDKKEKAALLKTGWRPYSIKIGDKYVPYMNMITPLDSYMAFCADAVALSGKALTPEQEMGLSEMSGQILGTIMNDYIDQAGFRSNTEKMMDIFNPSTDVRVREKIAANFFAGFLPMSGNVNAVRSAVKTAKGQTAQTKPEGFYDNLVKNYTDVFTSTQDYRRDVFGNRVDQYGLIITKATDYKFMQPEYAEMARLAEKGYSPTNIGHMLKKTGVPLEEFKSVETGRSAYDAMYDELTETRIGGKTLQEAVADLIKSPRYQSLNDGINGDGKDWSAVSYKTKKKLLDDTFQRYYNVAKKRVINKRGNEFVDKNGMTMRDRQQAIKTQMLQERVNQGLDNNILNQVTKF